jgi:hypothetical protein
VVPVGNWDSACDCTAHSGAINREIKIMISNISIYLKEETANMMRSYILDGTKYTPFGEYVCVVEDGEEVRGQIMGLDGKIHTTIDVKSDGEPYIQFAKLDIDEDTGEIDDVDTDVFNSYDTELDADEARQISQELLAAARYLESLR